MSALRLSILSTSLYVLLLSLPLAAQSPTVTLAVHVTDPSGTPRPAALVAASPRDGRLQIVRVTDAEGNARFESLTAGEYIIDVEAPGFTPVVRAVTVHADSPVVTISLDVARVTEHVVVTGADRLQTALEVSKAVTVVDRAEITARNEFSVADALRTVPGAAVQQLGGPGSFTSVKLRGLRERDTAFLIDGVRFRDAAAPQGDATAFIGDLPIVNLDRIEVLRGSGSSLYGSHAIGGAVNLITAGATAHPTASVAAEAGGLGFSRVLAHSAASALAGRVTFSVGAGHTRTLRGIDGDDDARNTSVQGRASVQLTRTGRVTARLFASDARASINESPAAIGPLPVSGFVEAGPATFVPGANDPDDVRDGRFMSALFLFEQRPSAAFGYTVSFHRLGTDRVYADGPLGVSPFEPATRTSLGFEGTVETLGVRADREWGTRQATTFAYEFERERYVSDSRPDNNALAWTADITQDSHAASIQHELRLDAVQVAGSVRAQGFGLDAVRLDPAERTPFTAASFATPPSAITADVSAARMFPRTGTKLRSHAGNAYRAPTMFERAGVSFGSRGYSVYGNPAIEPERSISFDVGADQTLAGGRAVLSATWFYTRLTRVVAFQSVDPATDPFGRSSGYGSADGRAAGGVELGAQLQPHRTVRISAAYTGVDAPPPAGDRDGLPRASGVPAHQFSGLLTHARGPLQVSFEIEAAGDHYVTLFDPVTFASRAYRFDGVVKGDISASYRALAGRTAFRLFATIENVFGREYFVQGFRTPGRTGRIGIMVATP